MNQSQKSEITLRNAVTLLEKLREKNDVSKEILDLTYVDIYNLVSKPLALHRFPRRISGFIFKSFSVIKNRFQYKAVNIFCNINGNIYNAIMVENLLCFSGIGMHKAEITAMIVTFYCTEIFDQQNIFEFASKCPKIEDTIWAEMEILDNYRMQE